MTSPRDVFAPVPTQQLRIDRRWSGLRATGALTVYIVLLFLLPSNFAFTALGSLGRPALLWGLLLAVWWLMHSLQSAAGAVPPPCQPVRILYAALFVVALVSFAAALLRGQPADQVSPAVTSLLRLISWGGVLFVAMDGIRTMRDLRTLIDRFVLVVTIVAVLGLVQTATGQTWVDQLTFPGFGVVEEGGVQARGSLIRAAGTATHPLEFAMLLTIAMPLALSSAVLGGQATRAGTVRRWVCVGLIALAILISASRSALLGFAVAVLLTLPALSRLWRVVLLAGAAALGMAVVAARPGLLGTMLSMFTGASTDPSALSRTNGLERAPGFIGVSPVYGSGFGTFLPRYYIFDNQWVLMAVELGLVGVLVFAALLGSGVWSAWHARHVSGQPDIRVIGQGLGAGLATGMVLLAGMDGLAFPISAGALVLVLGLCAAIRTIADADRWMIPSASSRDAEDDDDRDVDAPAVTPDGPPAPGRRSPDAARG